MPVCLQYFTLCSHPLTFNLTRNFIILFMLLFYTQFVSAQSNTLLLYGDIYYNHENQQSNNHEAVANSLDFSPGIGYQFNDHWTAGLEFSLYHAASKRDGSVNKSTTFSMGPFVRYQYQLTEMFSLIGHVNSQFRLTNLEKSRGFSLEAMPGIRMDIKNGLALNFFIGNIRFNSDRNKQSDTRVSRLNFNMGNSAGIGISKNIGLK